MTSKTLSSFGIICGILGFIFLFTGQAEWLDLFNIEARATFTVVSLMLLFGMIGLLIYTLLTEHKRNLK